MNGTLYATQRGIINDLTLGYIGLILKVILNPVIGVMGISPTLPMWQCSTNWGFLAESPRTSLFRRYRMDSSRLRRLSTVFLTYCRRQSMLALDSKNFTLKLSTGPPRLLLSCSLKTSPWLLRRHASSREALDHDRTPISCHLVFFIGHFSCPNLRFFFNEPNLLKNHETNSTSLVFAGMGISTYTVFSTVFFNASFIVLIVCFAFSL